jgi:hypothetical protein
VVGGTTAWSASVRGPEKPLLASVPSTYAPVPPATSVVPPPAEPTAEPEPEQAAAPTKVRRAATPTPQPPQPVAPPPPPPPAPTTTTAPAPTSVIQTPRPTTTATTSRRPGLFEQPCPAGFARPSPSQPCRVVQSTPRSTPANQRDTQGTASG